MPKKGEKLSKEHLAKMMAGREARKRANATKEPEEIPGTKSGKGTRKPKAPAEATKPIQVGSLTEKKVEAIVPASQKKPVIRRRGVQPSGETKSTEAQQAVVNTNTGPSALITNELPGQKEAIKAVLAETKKSGSEIKSEPVDPSPPNKTVDLIPSTDTKSLKGTTTPFSIQALRNRLLC